MLYWQAAKLCAAIWKGSLSSRTPSVKTGSALAYQSGVPPNAFCVLKYLLVYHRANGCEYDKSQLDCAIEPIVQGVCEVLH